MRDTWEFQGAKLIAVDGLPGPMLVACGMSPFGFEEDGEFTTMRVSRQLFDAIPRAEIEVSDLPTADSLEDDEALCDRFVGEDPIAPMTTVYFRVGLLSGLIKIGTTRRARHRKSAYKVMSGEQTKLYEMPGNRDLEQYLHQRFRPIRQRGEWHYPHPALVHYIGEACWF